MLGIILKFLVPIFIGYSITRLLKGVFFVKKVSDFMQDATKQDEVIEICPECGHVQEKRHKCPK